MSTRYAGTGLASSNDYQDPVRDYKLNFLKNDLYIIEQPVLSNTIDNIGMGTHSGLMTDIYDIKLDDYK